MQWLWETEYGLLSPMKRDTDRKIVNLGLVGYYFKIGKIK